MSGHTDEEIHRRVVRLASLRRAGRALSGCKLQPPFHDAESGAVRRMLEAVTSGQQGPERLRAVDGVLDKMESGVLGMLDDTGFAQLRATLPDLARDYREEALALLDVAVEGVARGGPRLRLLEYLITLLSARRDSGEWSVAHSPSSLTPRLAEICENVASGGSASEALEEALSELDAAAVDLQISDDLSPVLVRMRGFKEGLGRRILHPSILRGVVAYNLDVWNRRTEKLDDERTSQRLEEALLAASEDPLTAGTALSGTVAAVEFDAADTFSPARPAVLEADRAHARSANARRDQEATHDALAARVVDALRGHLEAKPLPLEMEALGIADVAPTLSEVERRALGESGRSDSDEVVRLMTVAHLLLRADDGVLQALEADPDFLRSRWLRRVHERIRSATNASIAAGDLDLARDLAAVKEVRVGAAIAELLREGRRSAELSPSPQGDSGPDDERSPVRITFFSQERTRAAVVLLAVVLLGLLGWRISMSTGRTQERLTERELGLVSTHLESGYRDGKLGRLFIGHVDERFAKLPPIHRQREGWGIALRLQDSFGVSEVLLYDADLGTAFHSVGDEIRVPVLYEDDWVEYED